LHALHRSLSGESAKVQWMLIIGSSLLAGTFNVAHASNDVLSQTMAAMPSLFLLLSFESFLSLVRHTVTRSQVIQNVAQLNADLDAKRHEYDALIESKQQEIHTLSNEASELEARIDQARATLLQIRQEIETANIRAGGIERAQAVKAKNDAVAIEQRRDRLTQIIATEGDIGPSALAQRLNISRGTVYRDLEALFEAGQLVKDGQGWEVVG
jgi:septal ring factor EnvC (AmiA/AmiB activator)